MKNNYKCKNYNVCGYSRYGETIPQLIYKNDVIEKIINKTKKIVKDKTGRDIKKPPFHALKTIIDKVILDIGWHNARKDMAKPHMMFKLAYEYNYLYKKPKDIDYFTSDKITLDELKKKIINKTVKELSEQIISSIQELLRYNKFLSKPIKRTIYERFYLAPHAHNFKFCPKNEQPEEDPYIKRYLY